MSDPQFAVHSTWYVARSTVLGAQEISNAAGVRNLESPAPPALSLHSSEASGSVIYGVPMQKSDSRLLLEWEEKGRRVKPNMIHLLQAKKIQIPAVHWKASSRHFWNPSRSSRTHPTCF